MDTIVTKEVVDLDKMFPGIEMEDIVTSQVPNVLSKEDTTFLDKVGVDEDEEVNEENKPATKAVSTKEAEDILNTIGDEVLKEEVTEATTSKSSLTSYLKAKIEAEQFSAFDDWDEKKETLDVYLSKQSEKTLHKMLDANLEAKVEDVVKNTPKEFFEALSPELQYAAKYEMEGGTDIKGLFAALAKVEEVKALDATDDNDQVAIARNYLQATGFGSAEIIEEQINEWKEANLLEKKAKIFKPSLDQMQKQQLEFHLQQQEEFNKQQRAAAQAYMGNVHKALEKADLGGIKLDRKTQADLYNGLTNVSYSSSSGKPTNLLGHLLDKIQNVEPDFELLAEVTLLLSDRKAYRESIKQMGKNEKVTEHVQKLKGEKLNGSDSYAPEEKEETTVKKKIPKPINVFSRQ